MKICAKCKIEKDYSKFYKLKQSKDDFNYRCKSCIKQYNVKFIKKQNKNLINLGKCVYLHKNPKTNEVFYVGVGNEDRPFVFTNRNNFWNNYYLKHGVNVFVVKKGLSIKQAFEEEKKLITLHGRRNLGKGTLVNLTNGGEGISKDRNYEDTHKCYCLKTQKIYLSINQFCIANNLSYNAVVQFLRNIKNNKIKKIGKDYKVRQLRKDNTVIWHSTEKFVRSEFENIDEFQDIEYKEDLNFNEVKNINESANISFLSSENGLYKKKQHLLIFNNINSGLSFNDAAENLGLTYHQVYHSFKSTKDYFKSYILDRYSFNYK